MTTSHQKKAKILHPCFPILGEVVLLFFICDGTFIVLKENLGKALDQKQLLMNIMYQIQKDMFQQKDDHSGKQKRASIILHQHTLSYTTGQPEVVGLWPLCPLE